MNFFQKWIVEKFLKQWIKKGLDVVSGPLNGKKSELTLGILAVLLAFEGLTDAESIKDAIGLITTNIAAVEDVTLEDARNVSVIAFLAALFHRVLKHYPAIEEKAGEASDS